MNNIIKTTTLLTFLTLLLIFFGHAAGGRSGSACAFIFACAMNFAAYWWSDKLILSSVRAQPVTEKDAPELYEIVRDLAAEARIPMPALYLIPSAAPNAFATGRDPQHAAVAVTQGIFELLNAEELKGVLAHELSHILNRDILIASVAATLAGAVSFLAVVTRWAFMLGDNRRERDESGNPVVLLVAAILMPLAAMLIQLAVSRTREYVADESGARLCGNPLYLASALRKLESGSKSASLYQAAPSVAHLFIVNPLKGGNFSALFGTHPPIEERVVRLERMAG